MVSEELAEKEIKVAFMIKYNYMHREDRWRGGEKREKEREREREREKEWEREREREKEWEREKERERERERERKRERGGQLTIGIAQEKHTQEMQASVAGLNCLVIVTERCTRTASIAAVITTTTTSIAAVITTTTTTTTTAMPQDLRCLVHHKSGNLWSFVT